MLKREAGEVIVERMLKREARERKLWKVYNRINNELPKQKVA